MAAPKTATICAVLLAAGVLAGVWYRTSRNDPADAGATQSGSEPVDGIDPAGASPAAAAFPAQGPDADHENAAGGSATPGETPSPEGFDSLEEYLSAPGATVEAWLMPNGGLDVGRTNEFSEPRAFDRLLWLLEEHANAELQDEAARWLQQLYALENGSDAVVTLNIACGPALCAARLQSADAAALDRFIAGVRKHDDLPMYTTMQMVFPDNPAVGIQSRGLLFTTEPSADFVVVPKEMADGIVPAGEIEEAAPPSM